MTSIREIIARKDIVRSEFQTLVDKWPEGLSPEAETRAAELEVELHRLNAAEKRQALLDDSDRAARAHKLNGLGDSEADVFRGVTIIDVMRAQCGYDDEGTQRAKRASAEYSRRVGRAPEGMFYSMARGTEQRVTTTTTTPGAGAAGTLVSTDQGPMIDILRNRLVARRLGATVLGGLVGNLSLPRLKASATAFWVGEDSAVTVSDPQTDSITLTPKHVGGRVEMSRQILQQSSPDVARMVEADLAAIIAQAIDRVALVGGGSNEPSGILANGSGINSVSGAGAPTWDTVVRLIAAVDTSNALEGSLAFAGSPRLVQKMRRTLRTTADTASTFIMEGPNTLAGYPYASTNNMPGSTVDSPDAGCTLLFGDWSQLVIGFWSELDVLINPFESTAYSKGNIQIRAMATCDMNLRHPLAFAATTGITTN